MLVNNTLYKIEHRILGSRRKIHWLASQGEVFRNASANPVRMWGTVMDITDRKQAEDLLRNIATGILSETGKEFFQSLARYLAKAIEAEYAFIGELKDGDPNTIHTIAVCAHSKIIDNFEYNLNDTPCKNVVGQRPCTYPRNVQQLFPKDRLLTEIGIESYSGTPLFNSMGNAIGLMVVLDSKAMGNIENVESILQIFAVRAASEMERVPAEKALRESEERFRRLSEGPLEGIVISDKCRLLDMNKQLEKMLGYEHAELIGKHISDFVAPESMEFVLQKMQSDDEKSFEHMAIRKDGSVFPVEACRKSIPYQGHKVEVTVIRDITERRRVEEALQTKTKAVQLLQEVAIASNEATTISEAMHVAVDKVCTHSGWPVGHVYMLGKEPTGELVPSTIWHLTDPVKFATFRKVTEKTRFRPGRGLPGRVLNIGTPVWITDVTKDESFVRTRLERNIGVKAGFAFPVLVKQEVVAVLEFFSEHAVEPDEALLDVVVPIGTQLGRVVERKRAEEEILKLNTGLEQRVAERTRELTEAKVQAESADRIKSAFLATMSHELRTPLNSIIGFTGILLAGHSGPLNEEQGKQLGFVRNGGRRLLDLINDILDISKIEAGQVETLIEHFDMREIIDKVIQTVTPLSQKKGLSLFTHVAPEVGEVVSDKRRVEQILLNLVNNAIKFTEQGKIEVVSSFCNDVIMTRVTDTGIGIKPEDIGNLFQPFRQIDTGLTRRREGTGLGLAICKKLVDLLGGSIQADSSWGGGSTFTFTLPCKQRYTERTHIVHTSDRM